MTYPDTPGYARDSDTSRAAAESIAHGLQEMQARVYGIIKRAGIRGATLWEVSGNEILHQTASARIRELFLKGHIEDSGRRRLTGTGRSATVWVAANKEAKE